MARVTLSVSVDERRLVKRVWGGWSEYLRGKRERLESRETAQQWHLAVTLRSDMYVFSIIVIGRLLLV